MLNNELYAIINIFQITVNIGRINSYIVMGPWVSSIALRQKLLDFLFILQEDRKGFKYTNLKKKTQTRFYVSINHKYLKISEWKICFLLTMSLKANSCFWPFSIIDQDYQVSETSSQLPLVLGKFCLFPLWSGCLPSHLQAVSKSPCMKFRLLPVSCAFLFIFVCNVL